MLKRLKRRFILINMLSVSVAVLLIFAAICVMTYRSGRAEIDRAVEAALRVNPQEEPRKNGDSSDLPPDVAPRLEGEDGRTLTVDERGGEGRVPRIGNTDGNSYVYTVAVTVGPDGTLFRDRVFAADMDDETLQTAVEQALSSGRESGSIRSLALVWKMTDTPFGKRIVFASTELLSETFRSTALISGAVCLASLLLFFIISYILAGRVIRPTSRAWEQQKRFVADASHDLKTPLTVILANVGILKNCPEATVGEQMQWIDGTAEEAERMRGLVNRMLELARSEDARQDTALRPVAVSEVVERVLLQFEPVAFERGLEIDASVAEGIELPSQEDALVRLIHILMDNAVKYSPEGEKITVALVPTRTGASLTVQNRGTPIPPEDLPHLFERFYRADKARSVGGFGLGLSIAKNLADSLRAGLTVSSTETDGTVFTLQMGK